MALLYLRGTLYRSTSSGFLANGAKRKKKKKKTQMKEEAKCFFSSETQAQPQESDRNHTAQIVGYWQIFGVK